jgi:hypothetical protein
LQYPIQILLIFNFFVFVIVLGGMGAVFWWIFITFVFLVFHWVLESFCRSSYIKLFRVFSFLFI